MGTWILPASRSAIGLAYVYPEHRHITAVAIGSLDSTRRETLERLWSDARIGYAARLNAQLADSLFTETSTTIDFSSWPAIAGDHSCSAPDLLHTVLESDWILQVNRVGARLQARLKEAGTMEYKRINALRDSDLELLSVDPYYATRAGSNNVHFLLPKPFPETDLAGYLSVCLEEGSPMNAIGAYEWHHRNAMLKARVLAGGGVSAEDRTAFVRLLLAEEAFGLHFLEDAFAAGHVAGSWGDAALRKGTHDYYNEEGLAVVSWSGESFVLMGDAWMREIDARRAARAVRMSLEQVLDLVGKSTPPAEPLPATRRDTLNVCERDVLPSTSFGADDLLLLGRVVEDTPIPGLDQGAGELPRFRTELGPFIGFSSALRSSWHGGGYLTYQKGVGLTAGVELALRMGIGLDGVMNESGDGLIFLDLGMVRDAASTLNIAASDVLDELGAITAAIPSRSAYFSRLRMPYWLLPFDLLVAAPVLALTSPETLTRMGVVAANGGVLGWQVGLATPVGRFQFILGREVGVYFYGRDKDGSRVFAYPTNEITDELYLLDIQSIQLMFPVLDYRNFRVFSRDQSSSLHLQLYAGVDIPTHVGIVVPVDVATPPYRSLWFFGIRASLDWRYYF